MCSTANSLWREKERERERELSSQSCGLQAKIKLLYTQRVQSMLCTLCVQSMLCTESLSYFYVVFVYCPKFVIKWNKIKFGINKIGNNKICFADWDMYRLTDTVLTKSQAAVSRPAERGGGQGGKCPGARRLLGARQGPQSTLSTYENKSIQAV